jgi:hypothetical protein
LFGIVWITGCTWLPTVHVLPCSNLAMKGNNGTNRILYHDITVQQPQNLTHNSSDHITRFQLSHVQVLWSWHHCLCIWALLSVIRGLAIATLAWMLDLWGSHQTVFVETGSSRWIFHSAVTCAAVVVWFCKQSFSLYNNIFLSMLTFAYSSSSLMLSSHDSYMPS